MAGMRIDFNDDVQDRLDALVDDLFHTRLGPMMVAEVIRNCPKDTGKLASTTDFTVEDRTLYITATGDEERMGGENRKYYAAWVDLGHRIIAWGHDTGKVQPPTAYMRRALYRRYPV